MNMFTQEARRILDMIMSGEFDTSARAIAELSALLYRAQVPETDPTRLELDMIRVLWGVCRRLPLGEDTAEGPGSPIARSFDHYPHHTFGMRVSRQRVDLEATIAGALGEYRLRFGFDSAMAMMNRMWDLLKPPPKDEGETLAVYPPDELGNLIKKEV